jgi:hypothetical protein
MKEQMKVRVGTVLFGERDYSKKVSKDKEGN